MHYNPATVLNELALASGRSHSEITWEVFDKDGDLRYVDAMRHPVLADSKASLRDLRASIEVQGARMYRDADAFLITLGLSEVWERRAGGSDQIINRSPYVGGGQASECVNRFLRVDEVVQYLREITKLIREDKGDSTPIVFTVSPIPLKTTTSGIEPQVANVRSKAILLAALHEFLDEDTAYRAAAYFPAYEIFMGAPRAMKMWQDDLRHPTAEAIDFVCRRFIENFALSDIRLADGVKFTVPDAVI